MFRTSFLVIVFQLAFLPGLWAEGSTPQIPRGIPDEEILHYRDRSLRPDGSSRDFEQRDALSYHIGGVRPLLRLISILPPEKTRALYFEESKEGTSIARSVAFLEPYVRGEKEHVEFANTTVQMDRDRAAAGLERYRPGRLFAPRQALSLFQIAVAFVPEYQEIINEISGQAEDLFPDWTSVLAEAGWLIETMEREFR